MLGVAGEVGLPPPAGCCLALLGEPLGGPSEKTPRLPQAAGYIFLSLPLKRAWREGKKIPGTFVPGVFSGWKMGFEPTTSSATN